MPSRWKPTLTLLFISPFLTEVLSGNMKISAFITPGPFLFLITVGYGFPVLLLREILVRRALPLVPLFIMGLMYGLYNEALLAKTVFHPGHSPIATFAQYGLVDNIRVPWALVISTWHAFFAVIYPIALVHVVFPQHAARPWFRPRVSFLLGIVSLGFGTLLYFTHNTRAPAAESFRHFLALVAIWVALAGVTRALARAVPPAPGGWSAKGRPPWRGVQLFFLLFIVPLLLVGGTVNPLLFYIYFGGALGYCLRQLRAFHMGDPLTLVRVGLGGQSLTAIVLFQLALSNRDGERAVTGVVFLIVFGLAIFFSPRKAAKT